MKLIIQAPQSTKFSVDEIKDIKKRVFYAETLSLNFKQKNSGKLRHGPQLALICSLQKWGGGLYLRALDEET